MLNKGSRTSRFYFLSLYVHYSSFSIIYRYLRTVQFRIALRFHYQLSLFSFSDMNIIKFNCSLLFLLKSCSLLSINEIEISILWRIYCDGIYDICERKLLKQWRGIIISCLLTQSLLANISYFWSILIVSSKKKMDEYALYSFNKKCCLIVEGSIFREELKYIYKLFEKGENKYFMEAICSLPWGKVRLNGCDSAFSVPNTWCLLDRTRIF